MPTTGDFQTTTDQYVNKNCMHACLQASAKATVRMNNLCTHLLSATISHSFTVLSFEALTRSRLSADHATWYTAPTCPLRVARNVPVRPSHTLTFLSNEALANRRPSGLKARWFTGCWWPVRRASGFLSSTGFQRKSVKSSEPDTNRSGSPPLHRTCGTVTKNRSMIRTHSSS